MSPALVEFCWLVLMVLCYTGDAVLIALAIDYIRAHEDYEKKGADDQRN